MESLEGEGQCSTHWISSGLNPKRSNAMNATCLAKFTPHFEPFWWLLDKYGMHEHNFNITTYQSFMSPTFF